VISCVEPKTVAEERPRIPGSNRARQGADFRVLYRAHFAGVSGFILRFGIDHHDAEDLAQRVFLIAFRQCAREESILHPEAYLRGIALRVIHEHFRWWRVRRAASWVVEHSWAGRVTDDFSPERNAATSESLQLVRQVLHQMSDKLRDTLVLLDVDDLSPREAADMLGVPLNTLRSRRALAREQFKRLWDSLQKRREHGRD
jgi:RNA polymerase sigma factor (sigma-70 family)